MRLIPHPLGSSSKRIVLGMPTGEEAPQGLRGWGVRLRGSGELFPSGFGQRPRYGFAMLCMAWRNRQASQTPIDFDALASKYI
ncbi:hypothetical protein COI69_02660 [Bacillus cereus]|uniref:Uncharacterized protein n=1 Tax=Bacillus cereus TaxID=1396 RepID=A0A9X7EAM1_BACCE|nr:hypothetical protein COE70_30100 [Bacillus cereus]PHG84214.1 hypothetical protein COI69_02660 [Bacillus cereus]